ncbi:MAG: helix-hairpin-helix domain-containing protein [Verrucomicrobiales bacterium]|nr:helix-hairpin-helix domain-containing protein [Verrucomicrobiales bacterium]
MKTLLLFLTIGALALQPAFSADSKSGKSSKSSKKTTKPPATKVEKTEVSKASQDAAAKLTPTQKKGLLDFVNKAEAKDLEKLPGVGATRAKGIQKARPLSDPLDLLKVEGIGEATFSEILTKAKDRTFPKNLDAAAESSSKPSTKTSSKSSTKKKP